MDELWETVALDPTKQVGAKFSHDFKTTNGRTLDNCCNLVQINEHDHIRFSHSTVLKFLISILHGSHIHTPTIDQPLEA